MSLTPADEGTGDGDRGLPILDARWLEAARDQLRATPAADGARLLPPTPSVRPGRYALHAELDGCLPIDVVLPVRAKTVEEVELRPTSAADRAGPPAGARPDRDG
jgi:hypothetical protein